MSAQTAAEVDFEIPGWAGKPPDGLHLDVAKGEKLIQKLMIDEKRCYFFGRNPTLCDFAIDHASCSRVHAALCWHKHLQRMFLIDLSSTHGTFIGKIRLEARKPEQLLIDQTFHVGASSRYYTLRERPTASSGYADADENFDGALVSEKGGARLLGLPEKEEELENLTEYNTALNRRIVAMGISDDDFKAFAARKRRKAVSVSFCEDEDVINPEDIDPSVGRFRNLVQTAVIPAKRSRFEAPFHSADEVHDKAQLMHVVTPQHAQSAATLPGFGPISSQLGLALPNSAPDVEMFTAPAPMAKAAIAQAVTVAALDDEPKKKKYAKEAWPGKKPTHLLV